MNKNTPPDYDQISLLDDESLISFYGACARVLAERGKLALTKKHLSKIISSKYAQNYDTPAQNQRGKIKRSPAHSILIDFLEEDWGHLFNGEYDKDPKYYVYYHTDPTMPNMRLRKNTDSVEFIGRPFYVGKGCGDRYKSKKRARSHLSIINNIKANTNTEDNIYHIFKSALTEKEALELEAKLITFFGCSTEIDRKKSHFHGMKGGLLINSDPAARPADVDKMIRVKGDI